MERGHRRRPQEAAEPTDGIGPLAFGTDGRILATRGPDHTVRPWDTATAITLATFSGPTGAVLSVAFSPDGRTLATGSEDQSPYPHWIGTLRQTNP
ncbi:WD40 repeat domain-containing protein [Streptomyces sp. NPDC056672]|uniref:WD40 repeat domain-containing protein n=1 Tax=Streptomyces sp. NPDC056672 TaxID=3345906 RepID=UPI0036C6DE1D